MKRFKPSTLILAVVLLMLITAAGLFSYFYTHTDIPKLYFEGDISDMQQKTDVRNISVRYTDGDFSFAGFAELKVQGTSSLEYDKKNYTIKLFEDSEHDHKMKVDLGWGAQNKYCLKANWIDHTHSRNIVSAKLASQVQARYNVLTDAPKNGLVDGFPVEIYSNGHFLGLYTFNIPKDAWQFGMDSKDPNHIVISAEGWEPTNLFLEEPNFSDWEVEVGEDNDETLSKMKALFDFVINSSDEEFVADFEEHLDLDSTLNYYILCDFAFLGDNIAKNMLLATYDGVKWYPSLYDMDVSWGTDLVGKGLLNYEEKMVTLNRNLLFARLEQHFAPQLAQRYWELRGSILAKEHVMAEFHAFRAQIPALTFLKEAIKWDEGLIRSTDSLPGYNYDQIERYLDVVIPKLDAKYNAFAAAE